MILGLPAFSFFYIRRNRASASDQTFRKKFETLYQNVKPENVGVFIHSTLFCVKRLAIALATVFANQFTVLMIFIYSNGSLVSFIYVSNFKPMASRFLNRIELFNEAFIILSSYWLILFSDFVADINLRRQLGLLHLYSTTGYIGINLVFIVRDMIA